MAANGDIDRRTDAERQRDISLARFAHDALASRGEAEYRLNPGDEAELANLGFGAAKSNENLYAAGAASAARLLGKPAPQAGPAHSYVTESRSPVIGTASDDDALYAADADAARKLYSMKPVRDEINADLRHKWAEQQRNRR